VRDVQITDDMIRLGQFLKLVGLVDAGADVKVLLEESNIRVNGRRETRRGRQLVPGDIVDTGTDTMRVRPTQPTP
jgi:ribosome-associated protein